MVAGVGAVLFRPDGKPVRFFSQALRDDMIRRLNPLEKKSAILECEFLALFCAMLVWSEHFGDTGVFYTDNNAVRDVMISCSANHRVAKGIMVATLALEC